MIRFDLVCEHAHEFDGWFDSNDAYDDQHKKGYVACPICGSEKISKQLMAPGIPTKANKSNALTAPEKTQKLLAASKTPEMKKLIKAVRKMRKDVEKTADNVGDNFAEEARKIHYKEAPARGIYGQATIDEAKELVEEGVQVMPLPTLPEDGN